MSRFSKGQGRKQGKYDTLESTDPVDLSADSAEENACSLESSSSSAFPEHASCMVQTNHIRVIRF